MSMNNTGAIQWQTEAYEYHDQYAAWCSALNEYFGFWVPDNIGTKQFFANASVNQIGNAQFVECFCDPCSATRALPYKAQHKRQTVTFQLIESGQELFEINGDRFHLSKGDILIWNDTLPMRFEVLSRLHKISVTVPLSRMRCWIPNNKWQSLLSYHPDGSIVANMVSPLIRAMRPEFLSGRIQNGDAITEALLGTLVSVINENHIPSSNDFREVYLLKARDYVSRNLSDPTLSPGSIAKANNISLRYLHQLFESCDESVQQHIISMRLKKAREDLANPLMKNRTITDIAYSWGFHCSAHFARRFRSTYGCTPTEYRQQVLQESATL